jgi:hypothetical protein
MENIKIKTYKAEALTPSKGLRYSKDENGKQVLVGVGACKDERIVVPNGVQIVGGKGFRKLRGKRNPSSELHRRNSRRRFCRLP